MRCRTIERKREREIKSSPMHWFLFQVAAMAMSVAGNPESPLRCRAVSREADWEGSSQEWNWPTVTKCCCSKSWLNLLHHNKAPIWLSILVIFIWKKMWDSVIHPQSPNWECFSTLPNSRRLLIRRKHNKRLNLQWECNLTKIASRDSYRF